jgi:beta-lactam-binding protein with PASTA domain
MTGWIFAIVCFVCVIVGMLFFIRSVNRWQIPEPTEPEAKQAEAKLTSNSAHKKV